MAGALPFFKKHKKLKTAFVSFTLKFQHMKIVKKVLIVLVGLFILLNGIGLLLPREVKVERSVVIKSAPTVPFHLINELKAWKEWSPWHKLDTNAVWTFSEPASGKGAWYSWASENKNVGKGKLTLMEVKPDELISTKLEFDGMEPSKAEFLFEKNGDEVKVTWTMEADLGAFPLARFFGLFFDSMIGPDYEKGLASLKQLSENQTNLPRIGGFEAEFRDFPGLDYIGIREKVSSEVIGQKMGEWYSTLSAELSKQGAKINQAPFSINYSASGNVFDIEAAMGYTGTITENGQIKKGHLDAGKVLVVKYYGDYMNTGRIYLPAFEFLSQQGMKATGAPLEFYVTDPGMEKDTSKWLTEIIFRAQ